MTTSSYITSLPRTFAFHGNLVTWPYSNLLKSPSIVISYATFTVIGSKILCNSFISGKKLLIIYIRMKVGWYYLFKYKLLNEKSDIFSDIIMETIFIWRNMTKSTVALSRVCRAPGSPAILWKKSVYHPVLLWLCPDFFLNCGVDPSKILQRRIY